MEATDRAEAPPFLRLAAANLVTAAALWLLLEPVDGNALRASHPLLRDALTDVPWHWACVTIYRVNAMRNFAAAYPAAACTVHLAPKIFTAADDADVDADYELMRALPRRVTRIALWGHHNGFHCAQRSVLTQSALDRGLDRCRNTLVCVTAIASLPPGVTDLNLRLCSYTFLSPVSFAHLPALTVLCVSFTNIVDAVIASLPRSMRELDVTDCMYLTDAASFAHLPALTVLRASYATIGDAAVASLPRSMLELRVRGCKYITGAAAFRHLDKLQTLCLRDTCVSDATLTSLPPSIITLNVKSCRALTVAVSLGHLPALRDLECMFTDVGDAALATLPATLHALTVGGGSYRTITHAASLRHLHALTALSCDYTVKHLIDTLPHATHGFCVCNRGMMVDWFLIVV